MVLKKETILFIVILILTEFFLLSSFRKLGATWDECGFIEESRGMWNWLKRPGLDPESLYHTWDVKTNDIHPPLVKFLFIPFQELLGNQIGMLYASRLGTLCVFAALMWVLFSLCLRFMRWEAAIFSLFSLIFQYRILAEAELATHDLVMAFFTLLSLFFFLKWDESKRARFLFSIVLGLSMLTKINGFFLIFFFSAWSLVMKRRLSSVLIHCFLLPCVVLYLGWPWLWSGTLSKLYGYYQVHRERVHYFNDSMYFGKLYQHPENAPWHYPIVMMAMTVPAAILIFSLVGLIFSSWNRTKLILLSLFSLPIVLQSMPSMPRFDGIRLFLSSFPFLAIFSGFGFAYLKEKVLNKRIYSVSVVVLFLIYHGWTFFKVRPYFLSYYNEFVGGIQGAARIGMNLTYWGDAVTPEVFEYLNRELPNGATISGMVGLGCSVLSFYKGEKLRSDITVSKDAKYSVMFARWHSKNGDGSDWFKQSSILNGHRYVVEKQFSFDGVPLVTVFRKES